MIMNIIAKIKESIKKKITFHKRITFVSSLYACLVNKKLNDFIEETILRICKEDDIYRLCHPIFKKEMMYILSKGIPFNPITLTNTENYKTKVDVDRGTLLNEYFKDNPIPTEVINEIENIYINSLVTKPKCVQKELVTLIHDMNINVSGSTAKLPAALYSYWWDYPSIDIRIKRLDDIDNIDTVVSNIMTISPFNLWYTNADGVKKDIKKILTFVKENL